jgi:hypothetical protein
MMVMEKELAWMLATSCKFRRYMRALPLCVYHPISTIDHCDGLSPTSPVDNVIIVSESKSIAKSEWSKRMTLTVRKAINEQQRSHNKMPIAEGGDQRM